MKTGKYFLGGAIKGLGGRAVKVFMKRPEVKKQMDLDKTSNKEREKTISRC